MRLRVFSAQQDRFQNDRLVVALLWLCFFLVRVKVELILEQSTATRCCDFPPGPDLRLACTVPYARKRRHCANQQEFMLATVSDAAHYRQVTIRRNGPTNGEVVRARPRLSEFGALFVEDNCFNHNDVYCFGITAAASAGGRCLPSLVTLPPTTTRRSW